MDDEYAEFVALQTGEIAREQVTAGEWTADEAPARASLEMAQFRADALRRDGDAFYRGVDPAGERIGWLWVAPVPDGVGGYGGSDRSRARGSRRSSWRNGADVRDTERAARGTPSPTGARWGHRAAFD